MQSNAVLDFLPPKEAQVEAVVLLEVFAEAWAERQRHALGSDDRAFVSMVIRDLIVYLRRLG